MKPKALKEGDTIGVIAQSDPITQNSMEEINSSVKLMEHLGLKVKFAKHAFEDPLGYGETAEHKAEDINEMFADKNISAIFCAIGGYNCNSVFDYLNFDVIRNNPKILCGYSDPTSLINIIYAKTGLITFYGPNFKSLSSEETDYGYKEMVKRFVKKTLTIGENDSYKVINKGQAEGELIRRKSVFIFKFDYREIFSRCRR